MFLHSPSVRAQVSAVGGGFEQLPFSDSVPWGVVRLNAAEWSVTGVPERSIIHKMEGATFLHENFKSPWQ